MQLNLKSTDISQLQRVESLSHELMRNLNVIVENYPELKANEIYLRMMNEIDEQNENVSAAISIFNRNVELFNNHIQIFPNNMINTLTIGKRLFARFATSLPCKTLTIVQTFKYAPFCNISVCLVFHMLRLHLTVELHDRIKDNRPLFILHISELFFALIWTWYEV